jgi:CDP-glucose 4,6-dehydratase
MAPRDTGNFWRGRSVLLTGHTGFKGSWLSLMLEQLGAHVTGLALAPDTDPNLYSILSPFAQHDSRLHDIRDAKETAKTIAHAKPEIVIHMAAQPLVRRSYAEPFDTMETNVMGTALLLDALRHETALKAVLIVTSDKVYENRELGVAFAEDAPLGGYDPYSASKAAAEIVTKSYAKSFFAARGIPVATARAGNVIGGGDWSADRLIPDLWRAYGAGESVTLRYPDAVRPWQHVLDPIYGYLLYAEHLLTHTDTSTLALNFGPPETTVRSVRQVAEQFASIMGTDVWKAGTPDPNLKESGYLAISPALAHSTLGWQGLLDVDDAIRWTVDWYKACRDKQHMRDFTQHQLDQFMQRTVAAHHAA